MSPENRFTFLVESTGARILSYLSRRVDPPCDAADLLADTLTVAWRRIADLPAADGQAAAWLFGIARGVLANHRRGQTRRAALGERLRSRLAAQPAGVDPSGEAVAIRDALRRLPEADRELLTMTVWDGLSNEEVAAVLEVTPGAVRQRLARARGRLRAELVEYQAPASRA